MTEIGDYLFIQMHSSNFPRTVQINDNQPREVKVIKVRVVSWHSIKALPSQLTSVNWSSTPSPHQVTMVKYALIAIVVLVAFQGCVAKPKGKQAAEKSPLEELAANTQSLVNNVTQALGIKELPDSKKVVEVLNNNAQTLANHVQEIVDKLKTETKAHQGEVDTVIKQIEQKLSETAAQLQQAAGPEATAKAKEIKTNLDNGLKTAVAQVEKLVKAVEPDATKAKTDIQNAAQTLLNQIAEVSNNLETQVKATLAEHEKTHKH